MNPTRGTQPDRFVAAMLFATVAGPVVGVCLGLFVCFAAITMLLPLAFLGLLALLLWLLLFPVLLAQGSDRAEAAVAVVGNVLSVCGFMFGLRLPGFGTDSSSSTGSNAELEFTLWFLAIAGFGAVVAGVAGVVVRWIKTRRAR